MSGRGWLQGGFRQRSMGSIERHSDRWYRYGGRQAPKSPPEVTPLALEFNYILSASNLEQKKKSTIDPRFFWLHSRPNHVARLALACPNRETCQDALQVRTTKVNQTMHRPSPFSCDSSSLLLLFYFANCTVAWLGPFTTPVR